MRQLQRNESFQGKRIILAVAVFLIFTTGAYAAGTGSSALEFLNLHTGARPIAMGGAFSALADDVNALGWNPGGLSQVDNKEVSFTHMEFMMGIRCEYFGYVHPLDEENKLGVSITLLNSGNIEEYDELDILSGENVSTTDIAGAITYSRLLGENVGVGATLKLVYERLDDVSGLGFAGDLGGLFKFNDSISAALVIQNLGTSVKFISETDPMPLNIKAGLAGRFLDNDVLKVAMDLDFPIYDKLCFSIGTEYILEEMYAVRLGFRTRRMADLGFFSGLSLGFGIINKPGSTQYGIDYAVIPYGGLGLTHRVSLKLKM